MSQQLKEDLNPIHIAAIQFDRAVCCMPDLPKGLIDYLKRPNRNFIVDFPIETDSGEVKVFTGYRVVHNSMCGLKSACSAAFGHDLAPRG